MKYRNLLKTKNAPTYGVDPKRSTPRFFIDNKIQKRPYFFAIVMARLSHLRITDVHFYSFVIQHIDYIINAKLGNLKNTTVIVSDSAGDLSDINDLDLACLFGNILDNAIEAQKTVPDGEKHIELLFTKQNSNRIIICKNTVSAPVLSVNKNLAMTKKR